MRAPQPLLQPLSETIISTPVAEQSKGVEWGSRFLDCKFDFKGNSKHSLIISSLVRGILGFYALFLFGFLASENRSSLNMREHEPALHCALRAKRTCAPFSLFSGDQRPLFSDNLCSSLINDWRPLFDVSPSVILSQFLFASFLLFSFLFFFNFFLLLLLLSSSSSSFCYSFFFSLVLFFFFSHCLLTAAIFLLMMISA